MADNATFKNSFNIEPLNSNNFHTWKFRMQTLFMEKEVLDCITTEYDPDNYTDVQQREQARKRDNRCKSYIVQCINDAQIELIREQNTAYKMWATLEMRYEKKGIPGQMVLRKKLIGMKLKEARNLETFLTKFDETVRQLKVTGADLKEEDLVCTLLMAMPHTIETVITILENIPPEDITLYLAKTKLRAEIDRRKASSDTEMSKNGKVMTLSPELAALVGQESMARHEVVKKVWAIIKEKDLYDPKNKQYAICDDALMKVIGTKRFRTFGMMKYLKNHFIS